MKITKYQHACVVVETPGKVVIDPGAFTTDFPVTADIKAVVITHIHADHCKPEYLQAILQANPTAQFFSTDEVAKAFPQVPFTIVGGGQSATIDDLQLEFFGGVHATIHADMTPNQNIGVMVNGAFYYPGDSFAAPNKPVSVLALPVSAPWLKISESMDFADAIKPAFCFPTHNAILSPEGQGIIDGLMTPACKASGIKYQLVQPGQTLEL